MVSKYEHELFIIKYCVFFFASRFMMMLNDLSVCCCYCCWIRIPLQKSMKRNGLHSHCHCRCHRRHCPIKMRCSYHFSCRWNEIIMYLTKRLLSLNIFIELSWLPSLFIYVCFFHHCSAFVNRARFYALGLWYISKIPFMFILFLLFVLISYFKLMNIQDVARKKNRM